MAASLDRRTLESWQREGVYAAGIPKSLSARLGGRIDARRRGRTRLLGGVQQLVRTDPLQPEPLVRVRGVGIWPRRSSGLTPGSRGHAHIATDKDLPSRKTLASWAAYWATYCALQTGEQGCACIEAIRQTAIGFRRASAEQAPVVKREAGYAAQRASRSAQALDVVRAFSYFSHLVNIAEDVHQNRRRRASCAGGLAPRDRKSPARARSAGARRGSAARHLTRAGSTEALRQARC
mgnify:CR=1 FL=1